MAAATSHVGPDAAPRRVQCAGVAAARPHAEPRDRRCGKPPEKELRSFGQISGIEAGACVRMRVTLIQASVQETCQRGGRGGWEAPVSR